MICKKWQREYLFLPFLHYSNICLLKSCFFLYFYRRVCYYTVKVTKVAQILKMWGITNE